MRAILFCELSPYPIPFDIGFTRSPYDALRSMALTKEKLE